jgi:biopolymer transport protein ExbB
MFKSILETIICGGPVMVPIIILSLVIWVLIIKKQSFLKKEEVNPDIFTEKVINLLFQKKGDEAINLCRATPGIISKTIKVILANGTKKRKSLLKSVQGTLLSEYPKLEEHLSLIGVLAQTAPLLGLLGTVSGMITTFNSITLHGTGDPQSLARGISEALITTQSGLIVAIPALLFHNHLLRKVENIRNGLEKNINKLINILVKEK